jgi:hypothetical protein
MNFLCLTSTRPLQPHRPCRTGECLDGQRPTTSRRRGRSYAVCRAEGEERGPVRHGDDDTYTPHSGDRHVRLRVHCQCVLVRAHGVDGRGASRGRTPDTSHDIPSGTHRLDPHEHAGSIGSRNARRPRLCHGEAGHACGERGHHGALDLISSCAGSQCPGPEPRRSRAEARGCGLRHCSTPLGWKLHDTERDHAAGATGPGQRPAVLLRQPLLRPPSPVPSRA